VAGGRVRAEAEAARGELRCTFRAIQAVPQRINEELRTTLDAIY